MLNSLSCSFISLLFLTSKAYRVPCIIFERLGDIGILIYDLRRVDGQTDGRRTSNDDEGSHDLGQIKL
jgi:hypothetical protein